MLRALGKAPFEPLHKASLYHLTIKTVFLVAVASGQRQSTLHALLSDPGHLRWENSGVRLIPSASFLAKNQTAASGSIEIFLPSISTFSSVSEDKVWCPVRALKWYLHRTKSFRTCQNLFLTTVSPHRAASRSTLARWLTDCISLAGSDALSVGPFSAHQTRALSSSWALFNGASIDSILQAAFWSNPNSFIACYLKDVVAHEASFARAVLTAVSTSGSVSKAPPRSGRAGSCR